MEQKTRPNERVQSFGQVAIYTRVSTTEQTTLNQRIRLEKYAKMQGWQVEIFEETESSRKTRPIKAALLQRLRKREYSGVLVYKLDPWARSSSELILEVNELIEKGVGFYSLTENLDFSTATGKPRLPTHRPCAPSGRLCLTC